MRRKYYLTTFILLSGVCALALQPPADSSGLTLPKKKNTPAITMRLHSMGLFSYMGKVVNYSPAADILFTYTTQSGWGVSAFKVVDVRDVHSHNNFAFALIYKSFHIGERLTITPNIGAALEQQNAFADHGSDLIAMLTTSFRLNQNLVVDHNAMFTNLVFEPVYSDWINRFRLIYSKGHWDATGVLWHNNGLIDGANYFSTGASVFYNRISLGKRVWMGGGVTAIFTTNQSNPEQPHHKKGIQFTAAITIK